MKISIANNTGMRRGMVISALLCLLASLSFGQSVVWEETFTGQTGKGLNPGPTTNMTGITKWSISPHGAVPTNGHFMVETNAGSSEEYFEGYRLDGECVWESESIDISTNSPVDLSLQLEETGTLTGDDSIGIYYRLDGTDEVQFAENGYFSDDYGSEWLTASQSYISGTNLQIVVRMVTTDADKKHRIDNVKVLETSVIPNSPPEISTDSGETNLFTTVGQALQLTLTATQNPVDAPSDTTELGAHSILPPGATFDTTNGLSPLSQTFSWTPGAPGEEIVTFYASDADGTNTIDVTISTTQLDPGKIWINELHYDNTGNPDSLEGIEVAGPAGFNLNNYKVYFYNGANGGEYTPVLDLSGSIDDEGEGFGAIWFPRSGIQNGPDGIALVKEMATETNVLQFITYEGSFSAVDGPAAGLTGVDIEIEQPGNNTDSVTLQLTGRGETYAEFTWVGPVAQSRGDLNAGQEILKPGMVFILF